MYIKLDFVKNKSKNKKNVVIIIESGDLQQNVQLLINNLGNKSNTITKNFYIGIDQPLEATIVYMDGIVNQETIDKDILSPLMLYVKENLTGKQNVADYLTKRYISMSNTSVDNNINNAINTIKRGKTVILINGVTEFIIVNTTGGENRPIIEPENETAVKGARDGFVENLETNISMIRRRIKDKNLMIEKFIIGRRSQSDLGIIYMDDIADKNVLDELKKRINSIDVDGATTMGMFQQYIEDYTYTVFPQTFSTERPDRATAEILEGKIVVLMEGSAVAITLPTVFMQFFQAVEDYNQRTVVANFSRIIRMLATFTVITLPPIYLTLIKYNVELIPIKFVTPIVQSRIGIALTPFLEILSMEIIVEFLREGGLRLPTKIAQTLSLVGGIIIGDTAIKSKIVSPATLLVVGVTVVATFLIPNYDMSLSIRMLRFPMLILANMMGIFGIAVGWFFIIAHLFSLDCLGVPYLEFHSSDLKDTLIRAPLWKMNKRPESIPNNNQNKQTDFRSKFRRKGNE